MKAGISSDTGAEWLHAPILRGVLISAALHLALLTLIQASPGASGARVVVINARLQPLPAAPASVQPAATQPEAAPTVKTATAATSRVLTAMTPAIPAAIRPAASPAEPVSQQVDSPASAPAEAARGGPQESGLPSLPIGIDTNWYLARQVDVHPKAIGDIEPAYPDEARRRNLEGTLKLMLKIDDLGRVQSAEVVEAMPPDMFDEAALAAFRAARFQPALKDGRPVRYQAYIRVEFRLKD